jgi:hypothetical protein
MSTRLVLGSLCGQSADCINCSLASVNFLLFCVGATQVSRILLWQKAQKGDTIPEELKKAGKQEGRELEAIAKDPKGAYENAKKV